MNLSATYDLNARGLLKKNAKFPPNKSWKKIGYLNVRLIKKFLKRLKNTDLIGVYVVDGKLAPIHCKRHLLAPVIPEHYYQKKNC